MKKNDSVKRLTFLSLCACVSLMLAYIESIMPSISGAVPGIKLGLANIMTVFVLYKYGLKSAAAVSFVRLTLSALLFGGVISLMYGASGALFSIAIMFLLKKTGAFSTVGVSIAGGVFHNLGQILLAMLMLETAGFGVYMAVLAVTGTVAGAFIGLASALMLKYTQKIY